MTAHRRILPVLALVVPLCLVPPGCGGRPAPDRSVEKSAGHHARMAQSLANAGRISEALDSMQRAIDLEPDNAQLRSRYGLICFRGARYEPAEQAFLAALELDPYYTDARNNLGAIYDRLGRKDEAEGQFRKVLEDPAYPTPQKAYYNLGLLYVSQGRDREAEDALRRSVEIDPKYCEAHYQLAQLLETIGNLDEAAREYEVAADCNRTNGEYFYRLGYTYYRLGDPHQATENLLKVRSVAPGSPSAARADELLKLIADH